MGRGFAVIDLETTGLFPQNHDRIVEVAIVHVSPTGVVEGVWETLVNPMRDMGAQRIHGISAAAAARAPEFGALAPSIASLLRGRVPVAHNASFDARFLAHSMEQAGCRVRTTTTGCARCSSRAPSCRAVGVSPTAVRRSDTRWRTLIALGRCPRCGGTPSRLHRCRSRPRVVGWVARDPGGVADEPCDTTAWLARTDSDTAPRSVLERLHVDAAVDDGGPESRLPRSARPRLLDRYMSATETDDLIRFAAELNLSTSAVRRLHRATSTDWSRRPGRTTSSPLTSGLISRRSEPCSRSTRRTIAGAASKPDAAAPILTTGFRLSPGDTVVITGDTRRDRAAWFRHPHRARADPEGQHGEEGQGARGCRPRFDVGEGEAGAGLGDPDRYGGGARQVAGAGGGRCSGVEAAAC